MLYFISCGFGWCVQLPTVAEKKKSEHKSTLHTKTPHTASLELYFRLCASNFSLALGVQKCIQA